MGFLFGGSSTQCDLYDLLCAAIGVLLFELPSIIEQLISLYLAGLEESFFFKASKESEMKTSVSL